MQAEGQLGLRDVVTKHYEQLQGCIQATGAPLDLDAREARAQLARGRLCPGSDRTRARARIGGHPNPVPAGAHRTSA
jgi:hypothetical protein